MTIEIDVLEPYQELVDAARLEEVARRTLEAERAQGDITILITDDETVAELNQRYLGKEGPTDVLSFPANGPNASDGFVLPPGEAAYLGDILIALPYTQRQAERLGRPLADELALLVVHGVLHLLGYDHATPEEKAAMWARQNAILAALGMPPLEA